MTGLRNMATAAFLLLAATVSAGEIDAKQKLALDSLVDKTVPALQVPSAVVLIDRGGQTVYVHAIGSADLEHDVAANADTPYAIGSITKSFTALAILKLVDEGKLRLDARVQDLLPEYDGPGKVATVQQLLNHTSGIPNYTNEIPGLRAGLRRTPYERQQMMDAFRSAPLLFEPGSKFSYSNSGYYLLGLIIEKVTGSNYYDYLRDNVWKPLGLAHTYSGDDSQLIAGRARGYDVGPDGYRNAPPWYYLVPFSAGSIVSSAVDVARYRRGVFRSDAFSPGVRKAVTQQVPLAGGEPNSYALGGVIVSDFHGHRKISHDGDIWGYTSTNAYYPDDDLTVVILMNRQVDTPAISSIESKIARIALGIEPLAVSDLALDAGELERYAGNYDLSPYLIGIPRMGFIAKDGKLYLRFGGVKAEGPMMPVLAQGKGVFRASFDDEWVFEFQSARGATRAPGFISHYRNGTFTAHRAQDE